MQKHTRMVVFAIYSNTFTCNTTYNDRFNCNPIYNKRSNFYIIHNIKSNFNTTYQNRSHFDATYDNKFNYNNIHNNRSNSALTYILITGDNRKQTKLCLIILNVGIFHSILIVTQLCYSVI